MKLARYPAYRTSRIEWVQKAPVDWEECSAKINFLMQLGKMLQNGPSGLEDIEISYLKALHVNWNRVTTEDLPKMWASPSELKQYDISNGDLLVCEGGEVGRAAIIKGLEGPAIIQNALHRVRNTERGDVRYFAYLLKHIADAGWFAILCNKATIAHLTGDKLGAIYMPVPTVPEQQQIAAFLDWKTGQIDALIARKEELLEKLKEKRIAVITQAVTQGLNPAAPMRDSGIPWLGQVPQHWEVKRLKFQAGEGKGEGIQIGPFGGMLTELTYAETGEFKLYGQENVLSGDFEKGTRWISAEQYTELSQYGAEEGDFLFTRKGSIGGCAIFPKTAHPGIIDSDTIRLRVNRRTLSTRFLLYAFRESEYLQFQVQLIKRGAILSGLNTTTIADLMLAAPPLDEQVKIAEYLDIETTRVNQLALKVESAIERLTEYRTALITTATTGKIDVRNVKLGPAA